MRLFDAITVARKTLADTGMITLKHGQMTAASDTAEAKQAAQAYNVLAEEHKRMALATSKTA